MCDLINQHDPTAKLKDDVIEDLANTMDIDKDGLINFNEVKYIFPVFKTQKSLLKFYQFLIVFGSISNRFK